jgi:ADP-ribosylglycohydrolase
MTMMMMMMMITAMTTLMTMETINKMKLVWWQWRWRRWQVINGNLGWCTNYKMGQVNYSTVSQVAGYVEYSVTGGWLMRVQCNGVLVHFI